MTRIHRLAAIAAAITVSGALIGGQATAAVPTHSAMEGVLMSSGGGPAADGNYTVTIGIYSAETGGNPVWAESGVTVAAKGGQFSYQLGSKTPLSAAALSLSKAWIGIQIGSDPELPRQAMGASPFALRAAVAEGLECTGCLKAGNLDAAVLQPYAKSADLGAYAKTTDLSGYAKTSDLGAYAKTSDLSSYAKAADLADYVKASSLAKVAGTGSYADLLNKPTLATVAASGSYADLTNKPVMAKLGDACGTNLVMKGLKADGSYECVTAGIAPDMINEISNDLIWNQFVDSKAGAADVQIKDGFAAGVTDTLVFPDVGLTQKLWVDLNISNSDVSKVVVELYGPGMSTPYLLYNGGKTGSAVVAKYNDGDALVSGDMNKDWLGKNIKGNWSITVKDTAAITVPPGTPAFVYDGKFNWSISIQTLSSKKIQIKGNLLADGSVKIGNDVAACDATKEGTLRYTASQVQVCQFGNWMPIGTSTCPGPVIQGICTGPTGCGNCNFMDSSKYCAARKADICSDSQMFVINYTRALVSNALWTNSFADNDGGQWSEVNNGTGDDHSNGSGWTAQCCYNWTPPRASDQNIGGVRLVYMHDNSNVYFRQAAVWCAGMGADLCSKTEYQVLRNNNKLGNASWGYWTSDHSDNDSTSYAKGHGPTSDDTNMGQHYSFACCASQRTTLDCPSPAKEYGGVCTTKVENSVLADWSTASTECGKLNSRLCSVSQTAALRAAGAVTASGSWTASYSDNDGGNVSVAVGNVGDDHPPSSQYGYACCMY